MYFSVKGDAIMNLLELMRARLRVRGGETQQDRMIKDKRETLDDVAVMCSSCIYE